MKQLVGLAFAALLLVGTSARAAVDDHLREAAELAGGIESNPQSMMEKIPRTCRILRRAAREATEGSAEAELISDAIQHCRRAMEALRNGNSKHAGQRLRRMMDLIGEPAQT